MTAIATTNTFSVPSTLLSLGYGVSVTLSSVLSVDPVGALCVIMTIVRTIGYGRISSRLFISAAAAGGSVTVKAGHDKHSWPARLSSAVSSAALPVTSGTVVGSEQCC